MMTDLFDRVLVLMKKARLLRKRGEALRREEREEDAVKAFEEAVENIEEALSELDNTGWHGIDLEGEPKAPASCEQSNIAYHWANCLGSMGGVQRRLDQYDEAVKSYEKGALIEERFHLRSTYNRVNFVKSSLQANERRRSLGQLQDQITRIARFLEKQLQNDATLRGTSWAWADLGDCLALTGNVDGAENAYRRASIDTAPAWALGSTLGVVSEVIEAVRDTDLLAAEKLTSVVETLRVRLAKTTE